MTWKCAASRLQGNAVDECNSDEEDEYLLTDDLVRNLTAPPLTAARMHILNTKTDGKEGGCKCLSALLEGCACPAHRTAHPDAVLSCWIHPCRLGPSDDNVLQPVASPGCISNQARTLALQP